MEGYIPGVYLDNAHSTISGRKSRNKRRLDAFVAKKRAEGFCSKSLASGQLNLEPAQPQAGPIVQCELVASDQLNLEPAQPGPIAQCESVASGQLNLEPARPSPTAQCPVPPLCEKVVNESPVANHTRSRVNVQVNDIMTSSVDPKPVVTAVEPVRDESDSQPVVNFKTSAPLVLHLPGDLPGVTKHHADFVKCDDSDTANRVRDCMQIQWSNLVKPGQKIKVKLKNEVVAAVVESSHFISKLSFDCLYTFMQLLRWTSDYLDLVQ